MALPFDTNALVRYANNNKIPANVKEILSTPAVYAATLLHESEGHDSRTAELMALTGAFAAAFATQPSLIEEIDDNTFDTLIINGQESSKIVSSIDTPECERTRAALLYVNHHLETVHQCMYNEHEQNWEQ